MFHLVGRGARKHVTMELARGSDPVSPILYFSEFNLKLNKGILPLSLWLLSEQFHPNSRDQTDWDSLIPRGDVSGH